MLLTQMNMARGCFDDDAHSKALPTDLTDPWILSLQCNTQPPFWQAPEKKSAALSALKRFFDSLKRGFGRAAGAFPCRRLTNCCQAVIIKL